MELRLDAVTIDCRDPAGLAVFWCGLLGVQVRGSFGPYVGLHPVAPGQPRLVLQQTEDPRPVKNTIHLDLHVPSVGDLPAEVERAIALGARQVERARRRSAPGWSWPTPRATSPASSPTDPCRNRPRTGGV